MGQLLAAHGDGYEPLGGIAFNNNGVCFLLIRHTNATRPSKWQKPAKKSK